MDRLCPGRLGSAHFWEIHLFYQPVHPTFADGYAILTLKTDFHLADAQTLVRFSIVFQNLSFNLRIFPFPFGELPVDELVIGAAVDVQHPAEDGDAVLAGQRPDGF